MKPQNHIIYDEHIPESSSHSLQILTARIGGQAVSSMFGPCIKDTVVQPEKLSCSLQDPSEGVELVPLSPGVDYPMDQR